MVRWIPLTRFRLPCLRRIHVASIVIVITLGAHLPAQEVERPVAFDSSGRLMNMSVPLATRLGLSAPLWPVTESYAEARLFERSDGTFVLSVQRRDGTIARYSLSAADRAELSRVISSAMTATGGLTSGNRADVISEPAGGQFVRNQTIAAAVVYGPSVAAMTRGESSPPALYLATVGATFFTASQIARGRTITRAQNHMATDGIWRGAVLASGVRRVIRGSESGGSSGQATTVLAGSLLGTIAGFRASRSLTDGEAHGATFGSTITAAFAAGIMGAAGFFRGSDREEISVLIVAALAGYPLGLRYVRRARYGITAGDISVYGTSAVLGIAGAGALLAEASPDERVTAGMLTLGMFTGLAVGDNFLVRRYNFTDGEGWLMRIGAVAGGLIAVAPAVAADVQSPSLYLGLATLGSVLGMSVTVGMLDPARETSGVGEMTAPRRLSHQMAGVRRRPEIAITPQNLVQLLAVGSRGESVARLLSITF